MANVITVPIPSIPGEIMVNAWPTSGAEPTSGADEWAGKFAYAGKPLGAEYEWVKWTPLGE